MNQPMLSNGKSVLLYDCPVCGLACNSRGYSETLVGFLSPNGHDHDGNCRTFTFICDAGHAFTVRPINTCPADGCDWKGRAECGVCGPAVKVVTR